VVRHRLLETVQHVLQVTESIDSIHPGGAGHASTIRVRLLHAAVRSRIIKLADKRPAYYNMKKYGVPINDLHAIGTISSFSATVIWIGLPHQGVYVSKQEAEDYIALWRLVAHYIGTPTECFESPEKARAMMESIMMSEMAPTRMSGVLARNIIVGMENTPPFYAPRSVLQALTRWMIGETLADALGIGKPSILAWIFVSIVMFLGLVWVYIARSIRILDLTQIKVRNQLSYPCNMLTKFSILNVSFGCG